MLEPGEGERAERTRSRRFWTTILACVVAGGIIGGLQVWLSGGKSFGPVSSTGAIVLAMLWLTSVGGASWYFLTRFDELEVRDNLWAGMIAAYAYSLLYPVWYILWKGALVPEPGHEILFIGTMAIMTIVYLGRKFLP